MHDIIFCGQDTKYYRNSILKPITLQDFVDYLTRCFLDSLEVCDASELF